jgi:arabinose-5-phosphate isomerase
MNNMKMQNAVDIAKRVFATEINALGLTHEALDETFNAIITEVLSCKGKIIITGMGKSGHIARKAAASFSSLGSCAIFIHPAECLHGDLGMIQAADLVIAISYSGESDEIIRIIPGIKTIGAKLISLTGNGDSTLAKSSVISQVFPKFPEACSLGLAPTSSTTATLVYFDALAVAASELKGFGKNDFKVFHPAGALGKSLTLRVSDCMHRLKTSARLIKESTIAEALMLQCETGWEILPITGSDGALIGAVNTEKLKTLLKKRQDIYDNSVESLFERVPGFVNSGEMAVDALKMMKRSSLEVVLVTKEGAVTGILRSKDILQQGVYI